MDKDFRKIEEADVYGDEQITPDAPSAKTARELSVAAMAALDAYNSTLFGSDAKAIDTAQFNANTALNEHNTAKRREFYAECLETDEPFLTAIRREFIDVLYLIVKEDRESGRKIAEIRQRKELISLFTLEQQATNRQLAHNGQWPFMAEKFAFLCGARAVKEIGGDYKRFEDRFKLSGMAAQFDIGATPTSNTQMIKHLQIIVDAIVFVDNGGGMNALKVIKADVERLVKTIFKDAGGSNNVVMPRRDTVIRQIIKCINRIAVGGTYEAD